MAAWLEGLSRPVLVDIARPALIDAFLDDAGWGKARRQPLPGDASFRNYTVLDDGWRRAMLMDAPPDKEDVRPYLSMAYHLRTLGYSAPNIFAANANSGLLVIEHLGDDTYTRLLDHGHRAEPLYTLAVDVLIDLHRRPSSKTLPLGLRPYDKATLLREALIFVEWYVPEISGRPITEAAHDTYIAAWQAALAPIFLAPKTLVLRDYHVDNLLRIPGRNGMAACGLLDFQDALSGPAAYDLMSLLEDARRDVSAPLATAMLAHYRSAFPEIDWAAFMVIYRILAAQRHMKVIGIFTRLARRDGKQHYLDHLPRLWRLLRHSLNDQALSTVKLWLDTHVPPSQRGVLRSMHA
jgi:aminoglycoside/choline kinase family phosphotransferase